MAKKDNLIIIMYQVLITFVLLILLTSSKVSGQDFDSLHVYAVYMNSMYRVKIDKELIKNEVSPIVLKSADKANCINKILEDKIKGKMIKQLQSNHLDIRMSFEFFRNDEVIKTVGVTPYNSVFIDYVLFTYDKDKLKLLEMYLPGLSKTLGIK